MKKLILRTNQTFFKFHFWQTIFLFWERILEKTSQTTFFFLSIFRSRKWSMEINNSKHHLNFLFSFTCSVGCFSWPRSKFQSSWPNYNGWFPVAVVWSLLGYIHSFFSHTSPFDSQFFILLFCWIHFWKFSQ